MYAINQLPKRDRAASPTGCCPQFEPKAWDKQVFRFDDKLFLKTMTRSFLHVPLNMDSVMKKALGEIDAADAASGDEYVMLSYDVSPWKCEHYISVSKEVKGAEMVRLSGTYLTKVFEGSFKEAGRWYRDLVDYVRSRGEKPLKVYMSYTTCPRCAKTYGKNYVVGFAQIRDMPETVAFTADSATAKKGEERWYLHRLYP